MKAKIKSIIVILILFLIAGCAGISEREASPANIGIERDALKKSPCACQMYFDYKTKEWM